MCLALIALYTSHLKSCSTFRIIPWSNKGEEWWKASSVGYITSIPNLGQDSHVKKPWPTWLYVKPQCIYFYVVTLWHWTGCLDQTLWPDSWPLRQVVHSACSGEISIGFSEPLRTCVCAYVCVWTRGGQRGHLVLIAHRKLSGHLLGSLVTAVVVDGCCGGPFSEDEGYSKSAGGCGGGQEVWLCSEMTLTYRWYSCPALLRWTWACVRFCGVLCVVEVMIWQYK